MLFSKVCNVSVEVMAEVKDRVIAASVRVLPMDEEASVRVG